jgi:hypothetical protein
VKADLSTYASTLVGSYKGDAVYPRFQLNADYTYSWDTGIRCVTTPCPSGDVGTWALYVNGYGTHYINLVSKPAAQNRWYRVYDGTPVVLKGAFGTTGTFTKQGTLNTTCAVVRCAAGFKCDDSTGTAQCVALPKDYCVSAADCKLVDDYCGGCNCLPLATWAMPPSCTTPVSCFVAPCFNKTVSCVNNQCVAH